MQAKNKFMTSNESGFPVKLVPSGDSSSSELSSQSSSDGDFKNSKCASLSRSLWPRLARAHSLAHDTVYRAIRQFRGSDSSSTRPPILRGRSSRSSVSSAGSQPVPVPSSTLATPSSTITGSELSVSPPAMPSMLSPPTLGPPTPTLPTKPKDMAMSHALASLLVYTIGVKARGFNKKEKYAATHVISLGESRLAKMLRDEATRQDFVAHNRAHLTRAYPKGSRLTSSNFAPHHMWAAGVQLVALNWQTFGAPTSPSLSPSSSTRTRS